MPGSIVDVVPTLDLTPTTTTHAAGNKCCNIPMIKLACCTCCNGAGPEGVSSDLVLVYDESKNVVGLPKSQEEESSCITAILSKICCCFESCTESKKNEPTQDEKRKGYDAYKIIVESNYGEILEGNEHFNLLSKETSKLWNEINQKEEVTAREAINFLEMLKGDIPDNVRRALKEAKYVQKQSNMTESQWSIALTDRVYLANFECEVLTRKGQKVPFNEGTMERRLRQLRLDRPDQIYLSDDEIETVIRLVKTDLVQEKKKIVSVTDLRTLIIKAIHSLGLSLITTHTVEEIEQKMKSSETKDEFLLYMDEKINSQINQSHLQNEVCD